MGGKMSKNIEGYIVCSSSLHILGKTLLAWGGCIEIHLDWRTLVRRIEAWFVCLSVKEVEG